MEDGLVRSDLHVNVVRQSPLRPNGSFKSTLSGRSTPRNSPTSRKYSSGRTPRREIRSGGGRLQWFRSSRIIYWLLLITLWTYLGFYVQSRWAHGDDNKEEFLGFGGKTHSDTLSGEQHTRRDLLANDSYQAVNNVSNKTIAGDGKKIGVVLAKQKDETSSRRKVTSKKKSRRAGRRSRSKSRNKQKAKLDNEINDDAQEPNIPGTNATYGMLVGPFGSTEDRVLEWSPVKRTGTCDRKGDFARLVWSRKFVLVFHELSVTGAPLSMLELATEFLSCGASVFAVVLSRKGGLMSELNRRKIKVLEDRADLSFKTAMKADLVIAGSAVCASWIDQYIARFPAGGSQIVWWIMENRREYFDRAKIILYRVKMLVFLSENQAKQWLTWCEEEKIKLRSTPGIVQLSVNDELAFVAGIPSSLNTPSYSPEKMMEKRQLLRDSVRKEMGLTDDDFLVMSLSSINPGKGQLLLVESANLIINQEPLQKINSSLKTAKDKSDVAAKYHLRSMLALRSTGKVSSRTGLSNNQNISLGQSHKERAKEQSVKLLIGSVGSKSNKVAYVKETLKFLSEHSKMSKSVLWTPATTRVASLYSAADVYVINSQGIGETFGRVTIEAMAFSLPVLGTEAGGTKEIVEHNITGLLHPVGKAGIQVLAQNLKSLLENPLAREELGRKGRKKVEKMYLKRHMYRKLADVLYKCMRIK